MGKKQRVQLAQCLKLEKTPVSFYLFSLSSNSEAVAIIHCVRPSVGPFVANVWHFEL